MKTLLHRQTKAPLPRCGSFSLPMLQVSPYFSIGRGAIKNQLMRVIVERYDQGLPGNLFFAFKVMNGLTEMIDTDISVDITTVSTRNGLQAASLAALDAFLATNSWNRTDGIVWPFIDDADILALLPTTPSSYQTIVTQTGTTAPAVSGSLVPTSTYASGTTFTWARTSAGVYTLTASTAVFNTAGKTAIFVGPLNNLNSAFTAVVTSSTVITITTAVQSLAVLGLLGFTATPTDTLLSKTMVYIQTYA